MPLLPHQNWTARRVTSLLRHLGPVELLLKVWGAAVEPEAKNGVTPLLLAAANGQKSLVELFLGRAARFDVPVRFDTDRIQTSVASFQAGEAPNVPVVEVRV